MIAYTLPPRECEQAGNATLKQTSGMPLRINATSISRCASAGPIVGDQRADRRETDADERDRLAYLRADAADARQRRADERDRVGDQR